MKYFRQMKLKNGEELILRSGEEEDAEELLRIFNEAHAETDFLLTYPDENSFTPESEAEFLRNNAESGGAIEILAFYKGRLTGSAGIDPIGEKCKIRHRAEFGISILRQFWGMGIGRALTEACIECAQKAGYTQLELTAVAENERALALYRKLGFAEYGRNPRCFRKRDGRYQEAVLMRLELETEN